MSEVYPETPLGAPVNDRSWLVNTSVTVPQLPAVTAVPAPPPAPAPEVWDASVPPGGYVCSACGWPVESEPCPDHGAPAPEAAVWHLLSIDTPASMCGDPYASHLTSVVADATCEPCREALRAALRETGDIVYAAQEAPAPEAATPPLLPLPAKWAKGGGDALHREWLRAQNPRFTDATTGTIWLQLRPEERVAWDALAARLAEAEEGWERWRKSAEKIADERDALRKACTGFQEERNRYREALERVFHLVEAGEDDETLLAIQDIARAALEARDAG